MSDARLRRLLDHGFTCATCGKRHSGLFDIAFGFPDNWSGQPEQQSNWTVPLAIKEGRDVLSEDFCLIGEDRFVRARLSLPLTGTERSFGFGVWGSLSQESFIEYATTFDRSDGGHMPPMFSWLSNRLPGSEATPVRAELVPQDGRQRPIMRIMDEDHPFFRAQTEGLSVDDLLAIYATFGHLPQVE